MIPLHPRAHPADPSVLTWVTPPGTTPFTGTVAEAPAPLDALLADGTLAGIRLDPGAVTTRLGPGRSWSQAGPRVRTALHAALDQPTGWIAVEGDQQSGDGAGSGSDAVLEEAARGILAGPLGDVAAAHGGGIRLIDVRDGVVRVELRGACHGCPAAGFTLGGRLEAELRREPGFRALTTVEASSSPSPSRSGGLFRLAGLRRRRPEPGNGSDGYPCG